MVNADDTDVGVGQIGELTVKGPGVMQGYLNRPKDTARTIVNGWLHTGDMAFRDEEGYITIVDRKKDVIIRGGTMFTPGGGGSALPAPGYC